MNDDELIDSIRNNPETSSDFKLVSEALTRIMIGMGKKGIKCGGFIYFGQNSFGLHNMIDDYGDYAHLGKMQDYVTRFSDAVINSNHG